MLKITQENYYSLEANQAYFNVSSIKQYLKCQKKWKAMHDGDWIEPDKDVFFYGHYVDCALTEPEKFVLFKQKHWERISKYNGREQLVVFDHLDEAIRMVKNQPLFMKFLEGSKQEIITLVDFHGFAFRCRLDVINFDKLFMTDLKTARTITGKSYCESRRAKLNFIDYWDYWIQAACYLEAIRIKYNLTMDGYIAAMEKTSPYDHNVFELTQDRSSMQTGLWRAIQSMKEMSELVHEDPADLDGCEACDYCVSQKVLTKPTVIRADPQAFNY